MRRTRAARARPNPPWPSLTLRHGGPSSGIGEEPGFGVRTPSRWLASCLTSLGTSSGSGPDSFGKLATLWGRPKQTPPATENQLARVKGVTSGRVVPTIGAPRGRARGFQLGNINAATGKRSNCPTRLGYRRMRIVTIPWARFRHEVVIHKGTGQVPLSVADPEARW